MASCTLYWGSDPRNVSSRFAKFLEKITSVGWDTHVGCEAPSSLGMGVGLNMHIHGLAL